MGKRVIDVLRHGNGLIFKVRNVGLLDASTLEGEAKTVFRNVGNRIFRGAAPYLRRTESSVTFHFVKD